MSDLKLKFIPLIKTSKNSSTEDTTKAKADDSSTSSSLISGGNYDTVELSSKSTSDNDSTASGVVAANIDTSLSTITNSKATVSADTIDHSDSDNSAKANTDTETSTKAASATTNAAANTASTSNKSVNMANFNAAYDDYKKALANVHTTGDRDLITSSMNNLKDSITALTNIIGDNSVKASDGKVITKEYIQQVFSGAANGVAANNWNLMHAPYSGTCIESSIGQASSNNAAISLNFGLFNSIGNSVSTSSYINKDEEEIANTEINAKFSDDEINKAINSLSDVNIDTDTPALSSVNTSAPTGSNFTKDLTGKISTTFSDTSKLGTDLLNIKDSALNELGEVAGKDTQSTVTGILSGITLADPTGIVSTALNFADSANDAYRDNNTFGGFAGDTVANFGDNIGQNIREVGDGAKTILNKVGLGSVGKVVSTITNTIADGVSTVSHAIGSGVEWAVNGLSSIGSTIYSGASVVGGAIVDGAKWVGRQIGSLFGISSGDSGSSSSASASASASSSSTSGSSPSSTSYSAEASDSANNANSSANSQKSGIVFRDAYFGSSVPGGKIETVVKFFQGKMY